MNRRSFFSKLALAVPALFLSKALDAFKWKQRPSGFYYAELKIAQLPEDAYAGIRSLGWLMFRIRLDSHLPEKETCEQILTEEFNKRVAACHVDAVLHPEHSGKWEWSELVTDPQTVPDITKNASYYDQIKIAASAWP